MQTERPPARSSPARGVALIATAVILGLFVLRNGFEDSSAEDAASVTTEAPDDAAADAGEGDDAANAGGEQAPQQGDQADAGEQGDGDGGGEQGGGEQQQPPSPRPPQEVTVLVANASGVTGAAGSLTDNLAGAGYQTVEATNAPETSETTQVLFAEGFDREAAAVAEQIRAPADGVAPLPGPPPVELQGARVLVLLGLDLAG
jgi:hypothetical protein